MNIYIMKDFDLRNVDKKLINNRKSLHTKPGQIWHCKIGINVWSEEDWKWWFLRPVLILANIGNMSLVAPTTSNPKNSHLDFYVELLSVDFGLDKDGVKKRSFAMLSQIKTIDTRRLIKNKYNISHEEINQIKQKLS